MCIMCCQTDTENETQPEKKYAYDGRRQLMSTYEEMILNETIGMHLCVFTTYMMLVNHVVLKLDVFRERSSNL